MKSLRREGDPAFWIGAACTRVRVWHSESGAIGRWFTVVSPVGGTVAIMSNGDPRPFSFQEYVLALALVTGDRGAARAMRRIFPHVARVAQQAAALLPAAEQRSRDTLLRRLSRADIRRMERRRERTLEMIRRNAMLLSEGDVVTAWRGGLVDGVHNR